MYYYLVQQLRQSRWFGLGGTFVEYKILHTFFIIHKATLYLWRFASEMFSKTLWL